MHHFNNKYNQKNSLQFVYEEPKSETINNSINSFEFFEQLELFHQNQNLIPETKLSFPKSSKIPNSINLIDLNSISFGQIKLQNYKKGPLQNLDKFLPLNKYMRLKSQPPSSCEEQKCNICFQVKSINFNFPNHHQM